MWNWLRRILRMQTRAPNPRRNTLLVAMRLEDMHLVHPDMDRSHTCSACNAPVGLYPSGQQVLKQYPDATIVCHICHVWKPGWVPAPGALQESSQGIPAKSGEPI